MIFQTIHFNSRVLYVRGLLNKIEPIVEIVFFWGGEGGELKSKTVILKRQFSEEIKIFLSECIQPII